MPIKVSDISVPKPADSALSLNWEQYSPGDWRRAVDECERFYLLCGRSEQTSWPIYGCASFTIPSPGPLVTDEDKQRIELVFKNAWLSLRHAHPNLASYVVRNEQNDQFTRHYSSPKSQQDVSDWLNLTFHSIVVNGSALEWFNKERSYPQAATVVLVHSKEEGNEGFTIFLQFPHDIADGVGIVHLFDQLFQFANEAFEQNQSLLSLPEWGSEGSRLSPSINIAASLPEGLSDVQNKRIHDIQKRNAMLSDHPHILRIPPTQTSNGMEGGRRERVSFTISKEKSARILAACKSTAPGVTVNHYFTVATALALAQLQPRKESSYAARFLIIAMVNLRPYLRKPFNGPSHAASPYSCLTRMALGIDASVPGLTPDTDEDSSEKDFYESLIKVCDHFEVLKSATCDQLHEQLSFAPSNWTELTPAPGQDVHVVDKVPVCNTPVSFIGDMSTVMSTDYGGFHITKVWVASEGFGADVPIFLATWDGQLELSSMFDTRYHKGQAVEDFMRRIAEIVEEHLHLG